MSIPPPCSFAAAGPSVHLIILHLLGQTVPEVIELEQKTPYPDKPAVKFVFSEFGQGLPGEPFPLGIYPAFDDDPLRDGAFEDFSAPDPRDLRPYPWGPK